MSYKLTDTEIKKALEDKIEFENFDENGYAVIDIEKLKNTLDLINRLEAKCEELQGIIVKYNSNLAQQVAENEKLKDALTDHEYANCVAIKNGLIYTHTLEDYDRLIGDISAEAYKEFAANLEKAFQKTESQMPNNKIVKQTVQICRNTIKIALKELAKEYK